MNGNEFIQKMVEKSRLFLSDEDIRKVQETRVAHAGFGGIGALTLELLARWGIKRFRLLDMDKYEVSNMNRQVFATVKTLGVLKAEAAAKRIKEINPYVDIEQVYCEKLNSNNVEQFIKNADIVINGIDLPSGQILLHYYAKTHKIPVINPHCMYTTRAAIEIFDYRLESQLSLDTPSRFRLVNKLLHNWFGLFQYNESIFREEFQNSRDRDFKTSGTLNFVTNLAACLAASETIKVITGKGRTVRYPKQIYFDPYNLTFKIRSVYTVARFWNYFKTRVFQYA